MFKSFNFQWILIGSWVLLARNSTIYLGQFISPINLSRQLCKVFKKPFTIELFQTIILHPSQQDKKTIAHAANIYVVKSTTHTSCLFPSGTTDAVSTTDRSMLRIVVLWQKYNKYVVKFTMICCRRGRDLNPGPLQTYYCRMRSHWAAKDSPSKVHWSVVYYNL